MSETSEYMIAKGHYDAAGATLEELEDCLRFLPGMTEEITLKIQLTSGREVVTVRIEAQDEKDIEAILLRLYSVYKRRFKLAERVLAGVNPNKTGQL